jgi:hypothetical protein
VVIQEVTDEKAKLAVFEKDVSGWDADKLGRVHCG